MPLINCKIIIFLIWLASCFIMAGVINYQEPKFTITGTKLQVAVVTLSTQDNGELLQQLKSGF